MPRAGPLIHSTEGVGIVSTRNERCFVASLRVLAVVAMALTISLTTTTPARAESVVCEQIIRRAAEWVAREATSGVTSSLLDQLRSLRPSLIGCDQTDPEGSQEVGNSAEHWRLLVALYFNPEDVDRAVCLMEKESGGDPDARNPSSGAAGLMQVMPFWAKTHGYAYNDLFNPGINLWIASLIRDQQGWSAWSPYLRGACRLRGQSVSALIGASTASSALTRSS